MPTITPTHRPGLRAALDRRVTRALDHLARHPAMPRLAVLLALAVGLSGAGMTVQRSA